MFIFLIFCARDFSSLSFASSLLRLNSVLEKSRAVCLV